MPVIANFFFYLVCVIIGNSHTSPKSENEDLLYTHFEFSYLLSFILIVNIHVIPYSGSVSQALYLANWPKNAIGKFLIWRLCYCGWIKLSEKLILAVLKLAFCLKFAKSPNFNPHQSFMLYGILIREDLLYTLIYLL